jgi:hypothetical protein
MSGEHGGEEANVAVSMMGGLLCSGDGTGMQPQAQNSTQVKRQH